MQLIREKDDGVYEVTLTFSHSSAPIAVFDEQGNPQIEGGNYQIKRATWDRYLLNETGAYIKPDRPLMDWGDGPINGCKVGYVNGERVLMWSHEEDFAVTGPGVKMHVRKLDRSAYRFREALQLLHEEHPGITLRSAHNRIDPIMRDEIPRKARRPYKPTGRSRGAPRSDLTMKVRKLKQSGDSCGEAQKKMFVWHRQKFPVGHFQSRTRESINRSVRRIYAQKT
jgi:hypothetical protein